MYPIRKTGKVLVILIMIGLSFSIITNRATGTQLLPYGATGDLFVLEKKSDSILRITPDGTVSIAVTKAEILAVTGENDVNFYDSGIAFDGVVGGSMFFTDKKSLSVLKLSAGTLSVLANESDIKSITGKSHAEPDGIAFASDGSMFVIDDKSDSVLEVDPTTGTVSMHTTKAAFEGLTGINSAGLRSGIVGGAPGGGIYVASDGSPDAIFEIDSFGIPTVLASGSPLHDLDVFMTTIAPNGDIVVADDSGAQAIYRVTSGGIVSTFLSNADLKAANGGFSVNLEGGIAFDSLGNFFVAEENRDNILKFDTSLVGSIWVSENDITAVTGKSGADFEGGIAFAPAPVPEPTTIALLGIGLAGLGGSYLRRRRKD